MAACLWSSPITQGGWVSTLEGATCGIPSVTQGGGVSPVEGGVHQTLAVEACAELQGTKGGEVSPTGEGSALDPGWGGVRSSSWHPGWKRLAPGRESPLDLPWLQQCAELPLAPMVEKSCTWRVESPQPWLQWRVELTLAPKVERSHPGGLSALDPGCSGVRTPSGTQGGGGPAPGEGSPLESCCSSLQSSPCP